MRRSRFNGSSWLIAVLILAPRLVAAAPCCGGGSAIPSLISGDDLAQLGASVSHGSVIGDAPAQGIPVFRADGDLEQTQTLQLDGAYRFLDRYQAGLSLPLIRRYRQFASGTQNSSTGFGDARLDVAYEVLPEWGYSAWKPHGFLFLEGTVPLGPSIYDAQDSLLVDARSRGFYSLGLGTAFFKAVRHFDFAFSFEAHRSFSKTVQAADSSSMIVTPGWGWSSMIGAGWSPEGGRFRVGMSLSPVYEGAIQTEGEVNSISDSQLVWNTGVQVGYQFRSDWSASLNYTDQTLMGPAKNVNLSRTVSLFVQKRWEL